MFCCKLYKVISKLLISAIFVFTSLIKVSADFSKPYKFDNDKMEVCIESNQITIKDRENSDIVYGIPVKFKNLDNGTVEYEFNICIDNKFWVGNCNLPYIEQGQNKEINGFEIKIRNGNLEKKLEEVKFKIKEENNAISKFHGDFRCSYDGCDVLAMYYKDCSGISNDYAIGINVKEDLYIDYFEYVNPQGFFSYSVFQTFVLD